MSPSIPTNFNDTAGLEDFARELGVTVGVGFMVPAVVLSVAMVFVFVKFCGGSGKTRVSFVNNQRVLLLVLSAVICATCVATCAVGWAYNNKIHSGVADGQVTLQGVIDSSSGLMLAVNDTVTHLSNQIIAAIDAESAPILSNISSILAPLQSISGVIDEAGNTLTDMTDLTQEIVNNLTIVKENLADLAAIQSENIIYGVPSPDEIPNVDSSYTEALNSSRDNLDLVIRSVGNMTNSVNDTLKAVNTTVTAKLDQLTEEYEQNAQEVLSYMGDFQAKIQDTNNTYADVSDDISHYSGIRKDVMAAILVLPFVLSALALVGVLFRLKVIIKISAALCFVFMFWYWLLAGVNYLAFYTVDQVCKNQDSLVSNALSIASSDITIPGTNTTIKVSEKIELLLKCSGNQTLIEIFEFNFLVDDLTDKIAAEINSLTEDTSQLNQTEQYYNSLRDLEAMENTTVNLDFLQNSSLPTIHSDLNNITDQVNNTINNPAYFASLQEVNDITNNLILNNGTEIHMYYDPSNITSLNCTQDPYDKMDQSDQQNLCSKAATAISLTIIRDRTIAASGDVYANVTDIHERLYGFENSLPSIYAFQNATRGYATQIRAYLDDAYFHAAAVINQVQASATLILGLITQGTQQIVQQTRCEYVGVAYRDLSDTVCQDVRHSLRVITAMMIIGAVMLFASTVAGMITSHKLERAYVDE